MIFIELTGIFRSTSVIEVFEDYIGGRLVELEYEYLLFNQSGSVSYCISKDATKFDIDHPFWKRTTGTLNRINGNSCTVELISSLTFVTRVIEIFIRDGENIEVMDKDSGKVIHYKRVLADRHEV